MIIKQISYILSSRKENLNNNSSNNSFEYENEDYFDEWNMYEDPNFQSIFTDDTVSSNIEKHVASYLASVLEKCITERRWRNPIRCMKCLYAFAEDETDEDEFVNLKMKSSKLLPPAKSTLAICMATENAMKKFKYEPGKLNYVKSDVLANLNIDSLFTMSDFSTHNETNHKMNLITLIIEIYSKKKQDYISKCKTLSEHDTFLRSQLKKLIHFKGQ